MLNRHSVFETSREANRLLRLDGAVGRKLRRFVGRYTAGDFVCQSFAFDEGHTPEQLAALEAYAKTIDEEMQEHLPTGVAKRQGTLVDRDFGLVSNNYQLMVHPDKATVKQLRAMVAMLAVLSESLHDFAAAPNRTALHACPEYVYRGRPCSIVPDDELWCIVGQDVAGCSGVLEWCYDETDAQELLAQMNRYPSRFKGVHAKRWATFAPDRKAVAA